MQSIAVFLILSMFSLFCVHLSLGYVFNRPYLEKIQPKSIRQAITVGSTGNFEKLVLKNERPVLVDFFASWCGPCKMMSPILDQLAQELEGKVDIVKIDADQSGELVEQFNVEGLPTFALFYGGDLLNYFAGAVPKGGLQNFITSELEKRKISV